MLASNLVRKGFFCFLDSVVHYAFKLFILRLLHFICLENVKWLSLLENPGELVAKTVCGGFVHGLGLVLLRSYRQVEIRLHLILRIIFI